MVNLRKNTKKILAMSAVALAASFSGISSAKADAAGDFLKAIADNTFATAYFTISNLNQWMLPDTSDTTKNLQTNFVTMTNSFTTNSAAQTKELNTLTQAFLAPPPPLPTTQLDERYQLFPFVNDYTFQSVLTPQNLYAKETRQSENPGFNYIKNVAGLNIKHQMPNWMWKTPFQDRKNYLDFYTTISSIQNYNAYILSGLYVDATSSNPTSKQQNVLIQQASNSQWFSQVASEQIGVVLRQILIYNSQMYVLMTQLLQTQKQLLATQAMTNTLLIVGNQFTESQLLSNASGQPIRRPQ